MTQRGYFFAFSAALLALHSISHVILWSKPVLNEQHGSPRMFSLLFCARAEICSLWEMLLQTLSWLPHSRHHASASSAQVPKGWKPIMSKLEHARRQNLLHPHQLPPGQGCWNNCNPAGRVDDAPWSQTGLCYEAMLCCCR